MRDLKRSDPAPIPRSLRFQWRVIAWAAPVTVAACGFLIERDQGFAAALRWTSAALAAIVYLLWELRRNLGQNIRPSETKILPTLGAGTALTLIRGLLTALLMGFLVVPRPAGALGWAPAFLYLGVAVADFFDGYVARIRNQATKLGAALDMSFDAFGVLVGIGVLIRHGQLPFPFLLIGLLYYLFHGHMELRARLGQSVIPLRPNPYRRMHAGFLFGYIAVALAPVLEPPWTVVAGYLFAAPVVVGFLFDWLFATAAISPDGRAWRKFEPVALRFVFQALPVGLRLMVLTAGGRWLAEGLSPEGGWTSLFAAFDRLEPTLPATFLAVAGLSALGMATAGWLSRLAALVLIALASIDVMLRGLAPAVNIWLLSGSIGILLLGPGRGVLWGPEDAMLLRQAGARDRPSGSEPAAA